MSILRITLFVLSVVVTGTAAATAPEPQTVARLDPARAEVIYLRPLEVSTIQFRSKQKVERVAKGSNLVQITVNEDNSFNLYPTVTEGRTNMQVTLGGKVYTFVLVIVTDETPNAYRTFTTSDENGDDGDYGAAAGVRPMKPHDIDTVGFIKQIERARGDRTFRETLSNFINLPIGRSYLWNESPVTLLEVDWFGDYDLLILKIEWSNNSSAVLNLHSRQVGVRVNMKVIPVTASQQVASQLFPGQMDTIWLFVQGYHLAPKNDWSLVLPPDAAAVQQILKRK